MTNTAGTDTHRLASERREAIRSLADMHGSVRVADLAEHFSVSTVTIRRDITELVEQGQLIRLHGGARSAAQSVKRGADRVRIGVVLPAARYYFREVLAGIKSRAARSGVAIVLAISQYDEGEEKRIIDRMLRAGVDGILIASADAGGNSGWLSELAVPVVLVERRCEGVEYARTDHAQGARLAVEHLRSRGHHRIGLAVRASTPTAAHLVEGYQEAMAETGGVPFAPFSLPDEESSPQVRNATMDTLVETCLAAGATAVIIHPEGLALPLLDAARDRGVSVPGELAMVSYDDELAQFAPVPLTAIQPPKRDVGDAALELLIRRMTKPDSARSWMMLAPRLVERESS